jgi:hypothetical protein
MLPCPVFMSCQIDGAGRRRSPVPTGVHKGGNGRKGGWHFQSLHLANRKPAKSMKTTDEEKFNRYTFTLRQRRAWLCALGDSVANPPAILQKGEEKSNRDNPKFKNRRNPMNPNDITFSNRDKNTLSGSPHLRFTLRDEGPHHVSSRQFTSHESRVTSHGFEFVTGIRNRSKLLKGWTDDGF